MPVIVEVGANSKTYKNIKIAKSTRHLKQRLFEVKNGETITSDYLKNLINKASHNMTDQNVALEVCVYYEHVGFRSGKIFNAGEDCSLYCEQYGTTEDLGGIVAWEIFYLPRQAAII